MVRDSVERVLSSVDCQRIFGQVMVERRGEERKGKERERERERAKKKSPIWPKPPSDSFRLPAF